jgi:DNA invertase Pin-like site-specific DNA recombinase
MATTAYLRVSTGTQDLANQKLAILEHARRKKFSINEFVEVQIS